MMVLRDLLETWRRDAGGGGVRARQGALSSEYATCKTVKSIFTYKTVKSTRSGKVKTVKFIKLWHI